MLYHALQVISWCSWEMLGISAVQCSSIIISAKFLSNLCVVISSSYHSLSLNIFVLQGAGRCWNVRGQRGQCRATADCQGWGHLGGFIPSLRTAGSAARYWASRNLTESHQICEKTMNYKENWGDMVRHDETGPVPSMFQYRLGSQVPIGSRRYDIWRQYPI